MVFALFSSLPSSWHSISSVDLEMNNAHIGLYLFLPCLLQKGASPLFVFVSCYPLRHLPTQKDIIIIRQHQTSGCPDTFTFAAQRRILLAAVHRKRGTLPASGANSLLRQSQLLQFIDCSGRPACPLVHRASSLLQPLRPTLNFLRAEPRERGLPTCQVVTFNHVL